VATTPLNIKVGVKGQQKIDKLNQSLGKTANSSSKLGSALKIAGGALAALGVGKLVKGFVDVGKEVESLQLRFKFLFGSAEEGAKAFDVLNEFAARVPFSLGEIAAASGNLAVVSKDAIALNKNLELTANIAAVAGLDFRTAGEQLQRAFSGGAAAADLFRERGVTALLGFQQGATISIEQTIEKFNELFGPGGRFGDAAGEMANTFTGTLSMISDSFRKFQEAVVKSFFGELKTQFGDLDEFLKQNQLQIEIMAGAVGNVLAKSLRASGDAVKWIADNSDTLTKVLAALIALKVAGVIFGMARALQAMVITTTALVALTGPVGWGLILAATGAAAVAYKLTGDALDSLENSMSESVETAKKQAMAFDDSNRELGIMKAALTQTAKATEKAIVKYKFYEDQIIRVKRSQEAATQSAQEFEDLIADKVIIQALREVIGEGFTPLQGKIAAIADGMNAFRNTASSALTDVIMGTKKLNEALGEIVNQTLRALIQGFINLGITIFILEPLERWLRNQVQRQKELNSQLKREIALRTILAMFGGGGFGIPFFADGGRTPANQPIVVGERGPELFVPNTAGNIMSNDQLGMGADAFGNISDNVNVTFNINTLDASDFNELLESRQELIIGLINRGLAERGKRSLTA
tara:strand:+ start:8878 stop:10800 length:1923 start_codon:yes stop_codon:yes gene_type:complete